MLHPLFRGARKWLTSRKMPCNGRKAEVHRRKLPAQTKSLRQYKNLLLQTSCLSLRWALSLSLTNTRTHTQPVQYFIFVYVTSLSSWMLTVDKLISLSRLSACGTSGQITANIQTQTKVKERWRGEEGCLVPLLRSWKWISAVAPLSQASRDAAVCLT